jgi:NAD(P)-dependent dehydrogenase (short-subunit alcohol dehydrogenase family)
MDKKIALITGANRGIGYETARQLGRKDFTVLIGVRNKTNGAAAVEKLKAESLNADFIVLDITDSESIKRAASEAAEKIDKLDVLVNNAGIFLDYGVPPSETDITVLRKTFDTNFFGVWEVTQAFLPLLKKSEAGRIVNVSSRAASLSGVTDPHSPYDQNRVPAYQASKVALNAITAQFARELRDTPIKVNSIDPGWVNSGAPGTESAPKSVADGARIIVEMATLGADGANGGWFDDDGAITW